MAQRQRAVSAAGGSALGKGHHGSPTRTRLCILGLKGRW